jgi:hypothetical protein
VISSIAPPGVLPTFHNLGFKGQFEKRLKDLLLSKNFGPELEQSRCFRRLKGRLSFSGVDLSDWKHLRYFYPESNLAL